MKAILCLPLLLTACACADEPADRAAIRRTIAVLNRLPRDVPAVAESPTAAAEIDALLLSAPSLRDPGRLTVIISHEPWGEATFGPAPPEFNWILSGAIRFIAPKVALVDGDWTRQDGTSLHQPVLFVMKKAGDVWKIAAARVLAPR
jgi:hypothetical protein